MQLDNINFYSMQHIDAAYFALNYEISSTAGI